MNWENDAWHHLKENAVSALKPDAASRALFAAKKAQQRSGKDVWIAIAVVILLSGGFCSYSWIQASNQHAENVELWNETLVAESFVTQSL